MDATHARQQAGLDVLIATLEHLKEPWGIKDPHSRHLYMNPAAYRYTATPLTFNLEGKSDSEFPAAWAECEDDLIEHDRRTLEAQGKVTVIETHYWFGLAELQPWVSEKIPLTDRTGQLLGVVWNARPLSNQSPLKYINRQQPSVLSTAAPESPFTRTELDTLFLLLQRFTPKEIAHLYGLSHRTVEHRVYNLYQKAGVHTLRQFEDYCRAAGLDSFIPPRLLKKGIQFI